MTTSTKAPTPRQRPQRNRGAKHPSVTVDAAAYVTLLIRANVTDPKEWPSGMKWGAKALRRIRAIERRCIARHGGFDWEKLSPTLQDEYDGLCLSLDQLCSTGEFVELNEYLARRRRRSR